MKTLNLPHTQISDIILPRGMLMKKFLAFAVAVAACFISLSASAEYEISRKRIYYYDHERGTALEVTNRGDTAVTYSAYTKAWDENTKQSTIDMVAYPPNFTLEPGQAQTVRLLLRTKNTDVAPLFYRLFISELPSNEVGSSDIQLSMSLPIFYLNQGANPVGVAQKIKIKGKEGIAVTNQGNTILHLTHFSTGGEGYRELDEIILPGRSYGFVTEGLKPPYQFRVAHGDNLVVK